MTYERLKEISKEYSRQGYINILEGLKDDELYETYKVINDALVNALDVNMNEIFMFQDDINFAIVNRWVEGQEDKHESVLSIKG